MGVLRLSVLLVFVSVPGLVYSDLINGCLPKDKLCDGYNGRLPSLGKTLATKRWAECPHEDGIMLDCKSWDNKGCIATECIPQSSGNQCASVTSEDSNSSTNHSLQVFQESCASSKNNKERVLCCQPESQESLLVGRYGAEPHEFPHQALLILKTRKEGAPKGEFGLGQCGGTIYNERWILTSAHCVVDKRLHPTFKYKDSKKTLKYGVPMEGHQVEVIVGTNLPGTAPPSHRYKVRRVLIHEAYTKLLKNQNKRIKQSRNKDPDINQYDIALLELDEDIAFNRDTLALKIAPRNFLPQRYSDKLMILGWGTTASLEVIDYLVKGDVSIRDENVFCYYQSFDSAQHLCLGGIVNGVYGKSATVGESGGPAVCRDKRGEAVLCGITSFGGGSEKKCIESPNNRTCVPSVYSDVSFFRNWIVQKAGPQDTGRTKFIRTPLYGINGGNELMSQVRITTGDGTVCGGTLVSPDTLVTAVHCVFDTDDNGSATEKSKIRVTFGRKKFGIKLMTLTGKSGKEEMTTKNNGFYTKFRRTDLQTLIEDPYFESDITVIKLTSGVSGSRPAAISSSPIFETKGDANEVSWLRNSPGGLQLRKFPVDILGTEECESRFSRISQNKHTFRLGSRDVCMLERYSGGSSCDREVGGGVFCGNKLCGVQVFRMCDFSAPKILTDISHFSSTINKVIKM